MAKCLVLGGCGFIGSELSAKLLEKGHEVKIYDKTDVDKHNIHDIISNIQLYEGDFTDASSLEQAISGNDIIYHLISTTIPSTSNENLVYDIESNISGTVRMLDLAKKHNIQKIIFSSSGGTVYGEPEKMPINEQHRTEPNCSYGIAKLAIEKYIKLYNRIYGLNYVIMRTSNPYGEKQNINRPLGAVSVFIFNAINNKIIDVWGDGRIIRDYIYIDDVVDAFIMALGVNITNHTLNIGTGKGTDLNELIYLIQRTLNRELDIRHNKSRSIDISANILDTSKAKHILGWTPKVSLEEGVKKLIKMYRK